MTSHYLFTPYSDIVRYVVAYLEPCAALAYSEPSHIQILAHLEPKVYSELCQGIFWHIQNANARILRTLAYFNFTIFRILAYLNLIHIQNVAHLGILRHIQ